MEATIKDTYGDTATVSTLDGPRRRVYLDTVTNDGTPIERAVCLALSPAQARKLAKALKRAARELEQ